jgi:phage/plasmid-like protein (TIGR03299 family)
LYKATKSKIKRENIMAFVQKLWGAECFGIDDPFLSVDKVMEQSGLNFEVRAQDVFLANGTKVPKCKATVRMDTETVLGTVGDRYTVLQNHEAFSWFQDFVDQKVAYIDNVGVLRSGAITFIQAKVCVDPIEITKGDAVESYITLLNSHTGVTSVLGGYFPRRIFCNNQLPALRASKMLKFKHTKNVQISMEKVLEIMNVSTQEFIATTEQYKFLASKSVDRKSLDKFVKIVFQKDETNEDEEMNETKLEKIQYLFENGRGADKTPNTMFKAFNAVNEYLNYEAGRSADTRLYSLWNGANADLNQRALEVATQMTRGTI